MRKEWFNFVAVTRKKMSRKLKEPVTHRVAMKAASILWPKDQAKILNRRTRVQRRRLKVPKLAADSRKVKIEPAVTGDKLR